MSADTASGLSTERHQLTRGVSSGNESGPIPRRSLPDTRRSRWPEILLRQLTELRGDETEISLREELFWKAHLIVSHRPLPSSLGDTRVRVTSYSGVQNVFAPPILPIIYRSDRTVNF